MTYTLRSMPAPLWTLVKRRAAKDGHSIRFVIQALLIWYVKRGLP